MSDYASSTALVSPEWAQTAPRRPRRPLRRGRRRYRGLRAGPPAGRGRLELEDAAVRWRPPRHRQPRGASELLSAVGHRTGHAHRALRRQQQLVRGVGVLAAQAVRHRRRPPPRWRAQVLGRTRPAPDQRTFPTTPRPGSSCRSPTSRRAPSARRPRRASVPPSWRSSTCAPRPSSTARFMAPPGMSETSPARRAHPGCRIGTLGTDRQRGRHLQVRRRAAARSTPPRASPPTRTSSPTAASASAPATPGSCCTSCSATSKVRNYDGSWTEWGSMIGVPIENPSAG